MVRACIDHPELAVGRYRSFSDLTGLAQAHDSSLSPVIAGEQSVLPCSLADNLQKRLGGTVFVGADHVVSRLRAVKCPWELEKMRTAGKLHTKATDEMPPRSIRPGMTELQGAHITADIFYSLGGCGLTRLSGAG